jgi:hypothetical protein
MPVEPKLESFAIKGRELTPYDVKKKFDINHSSAQLDAELNELIAMDYMELVYTSLALRARLKDILHSCNRPNDQAITASLFQWNN